MYVVFKTNLIGGNEMTLLDVAFGPSREELPSGAVTRIGVDRGRSRCEDGVRSDEDQGWWAWGCWRRGQCDRVRGWWIHRLPTLRYSLGRGSHLRPSEVALTMGSAA